MPQAPIVDPLTQQRFFEAQRHQAWITSQATHVLSAQSGSINKQITSRHRNFIQKHGLFLPSKPIEALQKRSSLILPDIAPKKSGIVFFWCQSLILFLLFVSSSILDFMVFSSNIIGMLGIQFIIVVIFSTTLASVIKKNRFTHVLSFEKLTTTVSMKAIKIKQRKKQREFTCLRDDTMTYLHAIKTTAQKQRGLHE